MRWLVLCLLLAGCDLPTEPPPWKWPAIYGCVDPSAPNCATPRPHEP